MRIHIHLSEDELCLPIQELLLYRAVWWIVDPYIHEA